MALSSALRTRLETERPRTSRSTPITPARRDPQRHLTSSATAYNTSADPAGPEGGNATMKQLRSRPSGARQERPRRLSGFWAAATAPLVYVNMPKSGCTTIKNLLYRIDSGSFLDDPLTIHGRPELMVHCEGAARGDRAAAEDRHCLHLRAPPAEARLLLLQREDPLHLDLLLRQGPRLHRRATTAPSFVDAPPRSSCTGRTSSASCASPRSSLDKTQRLAPRPALEPADHGAGGARRWRRLDFIGRVESFDTRMDAVLGARRRPRATSRRRG